MLTNLAVLAVLTAGYLALVGVVAYFGIRLAAFLRRWRRVQARQLPALHDMLLEQRFAVQDAGLELDRTVREYANRLSVGTQDVLALVLGRLLVKFAKRRYRATLWAPIVARLMINRLAPAGSNPSAAGDEWAVRSKG